VLSQSIRAHGVFVNVRLSHLTIVGRPLHAND
jgi:hypothetical protein